MERIYMITMAVCVLSSKENVNELLENARKIGYGSVVFYKNCTLEQKYALVRKGLEIEKLKMMSEVDVLKGENVDPMDKRLRLLDTSLIMIEELDDIDKVESLEERVEMITSLINRMNKMAKLFES
uniref:Uncharacterized protein n=1 Tax=Clastoptera arizonana TaxID=38151 RepID=A0A1B6CQT1_9HEMI